MKCQCGKIITAKCEIEYSQEICEFFCSPDCAKDRYFDYMGSVPASYKEFKNKELDFIKFAKKKLEGEK